MALADNLIAYWKLDESSGGAVDVHGGNNLTDHNGVGAGTGKINGARDFESSGPTQYLSSASTADLQVGDIGFTWSLWLWMESLANFRVALRKGNGTTGAREYALYYRNAGTRFEWQVGTGAALTTTVTGAGIEIKTWYHIVCWHDPAADRIEIAVDNGTPAFANHTGGVQTASGAFEIGGGSDQSLWWDGLIDEVGFWKRVLTSQERTDLYNGGAGLAYDSFPGLPPPAGPPLGSLAMMGCGR